MAKITIQKVLIPKNSFVKKIVFEGDKATFEFQGKSTLYTYVVTPEIKKTFIHAVKHGESVGTLYRTLLKGSSISKEVFSE